MTKPKPTHTFDVRGARSLVEECLTLDYFHPWKKEPPAIDARFVPGRGSLVVVVGENASGKSFFRRVVGAVCKASNIEHIHISMEGRRGIAYNIGLTFVYGDEGCDSTGYNASNTILGGIGTSRKRDNRHVIFWDEPDVGLSDNAAAGAGQTIRTFVGDPPEKLVAAVVVTHSKALLRELVPADPHVLFLGETEPEGSLQAWIDRPIVPRDLDELRKEGRDRFQRIQKVLNRNGIGR